MSSAQTNTAIGSSNHATTEGGWGLMANPYAVGGDVSEANPAAVVEPSRFSNLRESSPTKLDQQQQQQQPPQPAYQQQQTYEAQAQQLASPSEASQPAQGTTDAPNHTHEPVAGHTPADIKPTASRQHGHTCLIGRRYDTSATPPIPKEITDTPRCVVSGLYADQA